MGVESLGQRIVDKTQGIASKAQEATARVTKSTTDMYRKKRGLPIEEPAPQPIGFRRVDPRELQERYDNFLAAMGPIFDVEPTIKSPEQEDFEFLLAQYGNTSAGAEVQAILGALRNASEQFAASEEAQSYDGNLASPRLKWQDTPVRIYTATALTIENNIPEIDKASKLSRIPLLIAVKAPKKAQRMQVIRNAVNPAIETHANNRTKLFLHRNNLVPPQEITEGELGLTTFPMTEAEKAAFAEKGADRIPPFITEGVIHDVLRIGGRSHGKYHSAFVFRSPEKVAPGQPKPLEVHAYISTLSTDEIETSTEIGISLTCIAQISQNTLYNNAHFGKGDEGDGDF